MTRQWWMSDHRLYLDWIYAPLVLDDIWGRLWFSIDLPPDDEHEERYRREIQMLCSVEEAKEWLRIDTDDMVPNLKIAIAGVSEMVMTYLKRSRNFKEDRIPPEVKLATLAGVGYVIRDPDGVEAAQLEMGFLPKHVLNILYPRRTPTIA
ncbi:head-tail connector protein [Paraburkholderia unamae]|uniref:Head-tail connector protein n=1 Tax=Paraburkholderia unamae TaxID=219649 RepID=A0ACC6RR09_9BURK